MPAPPAWTARVTSANALYRVCAGDGELSTTDAVIGVYTGAPGVRKPTWFLMAAFGAATPPPAPALVSAPQYRPANSTVAVDGSESVAEDESNFATPPTVPGGPVLTYCML